MAFYNSHRLYKHVEIMLAIRENIHFLFKSEKKRNITILDHNSMYWVCVSAHVCVSVCELTLNIGYYHWINSSLFSRLDKERDEGRGHNIEPGISDI